MKKIRFEYRFTAIYLFLGFLWILFSDSILGSLITDHDTLTRIQTYKGWFYVFVTALLFFFYLRKHLVKLRNAEKKAVESDKLKTVFIQNISHEIRTPMNGIIGFATLLDDESLEDDLKKQYLEIITNSSNRLLEVVNEMLDISLIETGNLKIQKDIVDLNALLQDSFLQIKPSVNPQIDLSYTKDLPDDQSFVETDNARVSQVLINLLRNAAKFTEIGHIRFGYSVKNNELEFYVEDTGIGIPADFHDKIFERFHKAEAEVPRFYEGVGLGLSICKGNLKLLNGRIWVESEKNKGSVFRFTIPYNPRLPSITKNGPDTKALEWPERFTLLVAEDEENNFRYIERILEGAPIDIIRAVDGKEAVEICRKNNNIRLVLMDIKMPVMGGYEATVIIKQFKHDLPIIAQTAFAMENDKQIAFDCGCDDYLSKPFGKEELLRMFNKHLKPENSNVS